MTEFARQWAIRLPDGSLFTPTPPRIPGIPAMEPRVAIFETEADAENMLEDIRKHAQMVGVTNLGAVLVSRVVGPWGDIDLHGFLAAVEGHANGGAM